MQYISWYALVVKRFLAATLFGVFLGLSLLYSRPIKATFEDDYQNYLKTYDSYRAAHTKYLATRNQYLQFGTLTAKNDALTAVKEFLVARNNVLIGHMSLLGQKNQNDAIKQVLDSYTSFLNSHQQQIPQIGSLEDALSSSQLVEEQAPAFEIASRQVVWNVLISKINLLKLQFIVLETEANGLVTKLQVSQKDTSTLERWLLDARGKRELAEAKLAAAQAVIDGISQQRFDSEASNSIKLTLFAANQYLKEGISYLKELTETIKYGNY